MIPNKSRWSDFSVQEWNRLSSLSASYESAFKIEFVRAASQGKKLGLSGINELILDLISATGISSADVYGITFNPSSVSYKQLADNMLGYYEKAALNEKSKSSVRDILPRGIQLSDRRRRLDVFGLDPGSAVRIERMRQQGESDYDVMQERLKAITSKGNLTAATESNRIINATLETLWLENLGISKARDEIGWFPENENVTTLLRLPKRAKKELITRRDDRVCNYCEPLDGVTARIGNDFETDYGYFLHPPIHPRCRCFLIISV